MGKFNVHSRFINIHGTGNVLIVILLFILVVAITYIGIPCLIGLGIYLLWNYVIAAMAGLVLMQFYQAYLIALAVVIIVNCIPSKNK